MCAYCGWSPERAARRQRPGPPGHERPSNVRLSRPRPHPLSAPSLAESSLHCTSRSGGSERLFVDFRGEYAVENCFYNDQSRNVYENKGSMDSMPIKKRTFPVDWNASERHFVQYKCRWTPGALLFGGWGNRFSRRFAAAKGRCAGGRIVACRPGAGRKSRPAGKEATRFQNGSRTVWTCQRLGAALWRDKLAATNSDIVITPERWIQVWLPGDDIVCRGIEACEWST